MLNHQSPIPLYHQLADLLTTRIRTGEYAVGDRIPSEHQLVAAYGIGRPTVRQAIDVLVRRRMLVRRRGSGTYVAAADHEVDLFSLAGTTSAFQRQGLTVDTRVRKKMQSIPVTGDSDNPFDGGRAFFFSRRSCVEDSPVLIEDLYLHPELFSGIDQIDLEGRSIAAIAAERYFMRPTHGRQTFRIAYLQGARARDLGVSTATPILAVKRYLNFSQADNAIYAELFCRTDQFVFSQTIGGLADET
ncbi:MAG: GntR family transcriptional regulator [Deltaproteobacteria bacterium]|nr:GntR family transcriptional regulator [Deltaproteobacteria bacterium]